jgi:hypothetical protein
MLTLSEWHEVLDTLNSGTETVTKPTAAFSNASWDQNFVATLYYVGALSIQDSSHSSVNCGAST